MVGSEAILYQIPKDYFTKDGNPETSTGTTSRENVGSSPRPRTVNLYDGGTERDVVRSEYMVHTNIEKGKSKGDSTKTLQLTNKVLAHRHRGV